MPPVLPVIVPPPLLAEPPVQPGLCRGPDPGTPHPYTHVDIRYSSAAAVFTPAISRWRHSSQHRGSRRPPCLARSPRCLVVKLNRLFRPGRADGRRPARREWGHSAKSRSAARLLLRGLLPMPSGSSSCSRPPGFHRSGVQPSKAMPITTVKGLFIWKEEGDK